MAKVRTHEEILDQMVYAVACIAKHYGPELNASGLHKVRNLLNSMNWSCDSHWRCDAMDRDFYAVYLRLNPLELDFNQVREQSIEGDDAYCSDSRFE